MALAIHGPCTANELFHAWKGSQGISQSNLHARLGELRDQGSVLEHPKRVCKRTGEMAYEWEAILKVPRKLQNPKTSKCRHCNGTGRDPQARLF